MLKKIIREKIFQVNSTSLQSSDALTLCHLFSVLLFVNNFKHNSFLTNCLFIFYNIFSYVKIINFIHFIVNKLFHIIKSNILQYKFKKNVLYGTIFIRSGYLIVVLTYFSMKVMKVLMNPQ